MYLAAATDPTKSLQANMAALDNIQALYGSGKLHAIGAGTANANQNKPAASKQIVKTGVDKKTGKKVVQYSDGTISYGD